MDWTNFDPSEATKKSGNNKPILPPGIYVMAAKMFKRTTKNGKERLMFVCVPMIGEGNKPVSKDEYQAVFETCTLTVEASFRLGMLCLAVGRNTPFDVNSDSQVSSIFVRKPFKARVIHEPYQGKISPKIKEYLVMTSEEEKLADVVFEDWDIDGDSSGGYHGNSETSYDDYPEGAVDDNAPPPTDDDIPF